MIGHSFQIPMQYLYPNNSTTNNKNSDTKNSNSDILCSVFGVSRNHKYVYHAMRTHILHVVFAFIIEHKKHVPHVPC